jgi:hypothetical protein
MTEKIDKLSEDYIRQQVGIIFRDPMDYATIMREMTWFRNILYYLGEQWVSWFAESQTFGRRFELSGNIPTPVANSVREYVRSTKALVLNKRYTVRVWPNSRERQDIDASELGSDLLRWMDSLEDAEIEDVKEWLTMWVILAGNGFARTFAEVDNGVYILGKDGKSRSTGGEVAVEPLLPFNVIVPMSGLKLRKKSWVALKSLKPREWVEDMHHILLPEVSSERQQLEYETQLMQLVANVSPWKMRGVEVDLSETEKEDLVVYREIEYRPTTDYPRGRYVAMAGDTVVKKIAEMPVPVSKNGHYDYSVVHFPYNFTPGGFWATGGVDDLISPQNTINEIDQGLAINRKSLGRPFVLSPAQLTMRRMSSRGQALLAIEYDGRNAGGAKPEIHPGTPYPNQVLDEREQQRMVMQEAAGDPKNVLRGHTPTAGASGVMVDTLREAAEASHSPDIARFYRNWSKVQRLRLTVAQQLFTETRIIKVPGEGNKIKIKAFKGSDLHDNTDVRLELDSSLSSTQAGRNEITLRLVEAGFFGDMAMQPRLRREIGKRMGMGTLPDEENLHQDKAEREDSTFAFGDVTDLQRVALPNAPLTMDDGSVLVGPTGKPFTLFPKTYDPTFRYDNHAVHLKVHMEFILSAEFVELDKGRQRWAIGHMDMHKEALELIDQENTQKMAEKAAMGVTEPGGGGAPPAPPAPMEGPAGMMPEEMQMQGQEGGMQTPYSNY